MDVVAAEFLPLAGCPAGDEGARGWPPEPGQMLPSSSAQLSGCSKHWGLNTPSCVNPVFKQIILSE